MIEINLLPLELREKKKITLGKFPSSKQILLALGCLILLHLLLYIFTVLGEVRVNKLNKKWLALASQRAEIAQVKSELAKANENIPLFEQLIKERILWSKKLNKISDLLVSGVWLNEVSLDAGYLIIRASAASRTKDEPALIGKFMQNLKDDTLFSAEFSGIELGPIKKRFIAQTEVMDFILNCPPKRKD